MGGERLQRSQPFYRSAGGFRFNWACPTGLGRRPPHSIFRFPDALVMPRELETRELRGVAAADRCGEAAPIVSPGDVSEAWNARQNVLDS